MQKLLPLLRDGLRRDGRGRRDDGASAVEYGLLVALIAVVIAGTVVLLGQALQSKFEKATCEVSNTVTCAEKDTTDQK